MRIASLRRLASLQRASETITAFGGRVQTWDEIATLWIALEQNAPRAVSDAQQAPEIRGTARAIARDNPLAQQGNRLVLDGENWRVLQRIQDAPTIGLMTLFLEKDFS